MHFKLEMLASRWHNAATEKWTSARPDWQLETRLHQSRDSTKGAWPLLALNDISLHRRDMSGLGGW